MTYCRLCVTPSTRPNVIIGPDGVCSACRTAASRVRIDWDKRREALGEVVRRAKDRSEGYDCLIPVSGGKDSTWQVVQCLELGLKPLAVSWKPPSRTEIGLKNLTNLIGLGVDHIDYQINPIVERRFLLKALTRFGSTAIPMHLAMFQMIPRLAVRFRIPLIVWGENSAFEYAGEEDERTGFRMDEVWFNRFGVTHGTTAKDWIDKGLSEKDLTPYFGPRREELEERGVTAIFLGYYLPWDPETSLRVAQAHGFQPRPEGPKTGYYNYADIDDDFISIHHFLKWYKFGFTRSYDNLSLEIRMGRMTRPQAMEWLRRRGDETPWKDIDVFCRFVGISQDRFLEIIEPFRNRKIWMYKNGRWCLDGFLIPDWKW